MNLRWKLLAGAAACAAALASPASAQDLFGVQLWNSYPGQFTYYYDAPTYRYYYYGQTYYGYAPYYNLNRYAYYDTYGYAYDPYYGGDWNLGQGSGMYYRFGR